MNNPYDFDRHVTIKFVVIGPVRPPILDEAMPLIGSFIQERNAIAEVRRALNQYIYHSVTLVPRPKGRGEARHSEKDLSEREMANE